MKTTDQLLTAEEQRDYALRQARLELTRILATFPELRDITPRTNHRVTSAGFSAARRAEISARMKARWRKVKASGKKKL